MSDLRPPWAVGYTLILPPGWLRLDARTKHGTTELDLELDRVLSTVPRDSGGPLIAEARKKAHAVLDQARAAGALDLYLPLGGMHGTATPASFLISTVHFDDPTPDALTSADPEATCRRVAADLAAAIPGAETQEMPSGIAVRTRQVTPANDTSPCASTRVDYHWPLPSQPTQWVVASFTTTGAGETDDDFTELLVGLFDAIMLTWRWQPGLTI